jgi:hypothetical protein
MAALANSPIWHALGILPYDVTKIHPFPFSRDGHFIAWLASIGRKEFVRLCQTHNLTTILDSFEKESALLKARIREQRRII